MSTLCSVCQKLIQPLSQVHDWAAGMLPHPPHNSISDLQSAAERGCPLCKLVWKSLTSQEKTALCCERTTLENRSAAVRSFVRYSRLDGTIINFTLQPPDNKDIQISKHICLQAIHPNSFVGYSRQTMCRNTGSDEVIELATQWVLNCIQNHDNCRAKEPSVTNNDGLPTRLLFVGSLGNSSIRLCHTQLFPPSTLYMTLSHCWEEKPLLKLSTHNLKLFEKGISLEDLPKTFRDAINFTQHTAVEYIWIDSLCIIQDSEEDWKREALLMEQVYARAYCNIAATAGSDAHSGCFMDRNIEDVCPTAFEIPLSSDQALTKNPPKRLFHTLLQHPQVSNLKKFLGHGPLLDPGTYICHDLHLWKIEITESTLTSRAWVFQERLLAKRVLHFASNQIFFECRSFRAAEVCPLGWTLPPSLDFPFNTRLKVIVFDAFKERPTVWQGIFAQSERREQVLLMWNVLVERFSACGLTYETDRLPAIAGLARLVQKRLKCEYLAGLWRFQLVSQLLWRRIGRADRHSTYRAPSWSWASSPGKADFDRWLSGSMTVESFSSYKERLKGYKNVVLENVDVRTMDGNELSQVIHGTLRLSGILIPSYITPLKDRSPESEVRYQIAMRQIALTFSQIPAMSWINHS